VKGIEAVHPDEGIAPWAGIAVMFGQVQDQPGPADL
jgi:hypothetical protein